MSFKFILNLFIYSKRKEKFHVETELKSQCKQHFCEILPKYTMSEQTPLHRIFLISEIVTNNYLSVFIQLVIVLHFLSIFKNWKLDQRNLMVQYACVLRIYILPDEYNVKYNTTRQIKTSLVFLYSTYKQLCNGNTWTTICSFKRF